MKRSFAPFIILLFLVIGLGVFFVFRTEGPARAPETESAVTPSPVPTATPAPTAEVTATPAPTATPSPTPAPTATPAPTEAPTATPSPTPTASPTPTPTPEPRVEYSASGELESDSGAKLNIVVKWTGYRDLDGKTKLQLDVYVRSYSLYTGDRIDDVVMKVGDQIRYGSSKAIQIDSNTRTDTLLASTVVEVTPDTDIPLEITWYFNGSYSGQEISTITATGAVQLPA